MTEQGYQKKITTYLEAKGAYVIKVITANRKGIPDIIACYRGYFVAIEVKVPEKRNNTTKLQEFNIKKIREADGYATVACLVEDVIPIIEEIDYELDYNGKR
jgi:Holliday junction resolvase